MNVATGVTDVIVFQATQEELERTPEKVTAIREKIKNIPPIVFGVDVLGDMGSKLHFIGEPKFEESGDTLIKCTIHVKLTVNKKLAESACIPEEQERDFVAYAKCSDIDKDKYDYEFGCRIALSKAKINAYSFYQRMLIRIIEKMFKNVVMTVGFAEKLKKLVHGNVKYIFNLCEEKYPGGHNEQQADGENPPMKEENPEAPVPADCVGAPDTKE